MKMLVVIDHADKGLESKLESLSVSGTEITLLPLGISHLDLPAQYPCYTFLPFEFEAFRREALDYVIKLPWSCKGADKLFEKYGEAYWFFSHTEKSIWSSRIPHFLFYLQQISRAKKDFKQLEFFLEDKSLERFLNNRKPHLSFIMNMVLFKKALVQELLKFVVKYYCLKWAYPLKVKTSPKMLISLYPEWFKINQDGKCSDMFFSDLVQPVEPWGVCLIGYHWKQLWSKLKNDYPLLREKNIFFIESLVSFSDVLKEINPYSLFQYSRDLFKISRWKSKFSFGGTDVTSLVALEVTNSFLNGSFFSNKFLFRSFKRLNWSEIKECYYRLEFQPFENTFLLASQRTVFSGFQHSVFGPHFINYVFPQGALKWQKAPDKVFATGQAVQEELIKAGLEKENIELVGAVRFKKVFSFKGKSKKEIRYSLGIGQDEFVLFMPISLFLSENKTMLKELNKALENFSCPVRILLKINPNKKYDKEFINGIESELALLKGKAQIKMFIEDSRYYEFIIASDALFLSGGTASLEALFLGTPSIIFEIDEVLNHNPMAAYDKVFMVVRNHLELLTALDKTQRKEFLPEEQQKAVMLARLFDSKTDNAGSLF